MVRDTMYFIYIFNYLHLFTSIYIYVLEAMIWYLIALYGKMNGKVSEWMNEWVNEWTNKWSKEWMNDGMKID